jgi:hypothetical protein
MKGRGMPSQSELWKESVPADLIPAAEHLRDSFDQAHFSFGWTTTHLCYWRLHNKTPRLGTRDIQPYLDALNVLKARVGFPPSQRFISLLSKETTPAIFKAFFNFYMDGLKLQIFLIFSALLQIGMRNSNRISKSPIEWARGLSENLIEYYRHRIPLWIKDVCDEHPWDPNEDAEELIFWRKWEAPSFLVMEPSRYMVYDQQRVWERNDPETSSKWLEAFSEDYVLILGMELKDAAGRASLKQAMMPSAEKAAKELQVNQTFNVNGPNARINIGSTDNSTNVFHQNTPFSEMRKAIEAGVADAIERADLLKRLAELEQAKDRKSASERYQAFVTLAANHMTTLGPLLPVLGHWVHSLVA